MLLMKSKKIVKASKRVVDAMNAGKVRVIRDCRNAGRDYFIDKVEAHNLYKIGKLSFDETNNCYFDKN